MEQTLGKRISANRKKLKLTQDQLAEKLGVTAQAVSKWENDQSCPDIATLPKLAEIFNITTDELLGRDVPHAVHEGEIFSEVLEDDEENENDGLHFQKGNWEFRWGNGKRDTLGFAVFVICVGVLYLLSQIFLWDLSLWDIIWPTSIIIFGIWGLVEKLSFFCVGCILFGGYALANKLFPLPLEFDGKILWAVIILLFGTSLLADALKKSKKPIFTILKTPHSKICDNKQNYGYEYTDDTFRYECRFSDVHQKIALNTLREGHVKVDFGDYTIDLTEIMSVSDNCSIYAQCNFGELVFLIPKCYRVSITNATTFADIEVIGTPDEQPSGEINLHCNVSFGEIDIEYV